jgi:hypothetical protein
MSDREVSEERNDGVGVPDEPEPDAFEWTAEPEAPDAAGMPGEYVNEPGEGVPGVRRDPAPFD